MEERKTEANQKQSHFSFSPTGEVMSARKGFGMND
jgi:hypothetical protein